MAIISVAVCDRCRRSIAYGHVSKKYVREWARKIKLSGYEIVEKRGKINEQNE